MKTENSKNNGFNYSLEDKLSVKMLTILAIVVVIVFVALGLWSNHRNAEDTGVEDSTYIDIVREYDESNPVEVMRVTDEENDVYTLNYVKSFDGLSGKYYITKGDEFYAESNFTGMTEPSVYINVEVGNVVGEVESSSTGEEVGTAEAISEIAEEEEVTSTSGETEVAETTAEVAETTASDNLGETAEIIESNKIEFDWSKYQDKALEDMLVYQFTQEESIEFIKELQRYGYSVRTHISTALYNELYLSGGASDKNLRVIVANTQELLLVSNTDIQVDIDSLMMAKGVTVQESGEIENEQEN